MLSYHVVALFLNSYTQEVVSALSLIKTTDPTQATAYVSNLNQTRPQWIRDMVSLVSNLHNELPIKVSLQTKEVEVDAFGNELSSVVLDPFSADTTTSLVYSMEALERTNLYRAMKWELFQDNPTFTDVTARFVIKNLQGQVVLTAQENQGIYLGRTPYGIELDISLTNILAGEYRHSMVLYKDQKSYAVFTGPLTVLQNQVP